MRPFLTLLVSSLLVTCARAQLLGFVDSVEVHRTDTIYFAFGSDRLDATAAAKIDALAADRPAALELYLEGHTDAVGSDAVNESLAHRRSLNARNRAIAAGWPPEEIELRHFGERRLAVRTTARERRNRRVLLRSGLPKRYARVRGRVTDEEGAPLAGVVVSHGPHLRDTVRSRPDGSYDLYLPLDEDLRLDVFAPGHFFRSERLRLSDSSTLAQPVTALTAANPGSRMSVPDLFFVGNQTNLLKESFPTLPRLLQFLRTSPDLRVELAGHVNSPGPKKGPGSWEYKLAFDRARVVYDYLIRFGIPRERLRYRGYSNYEMVFPKAKSEAQMRLNRRVEIRVLED